jgi:hypothetical protein
MRGITEMEMGSGDGDHANVKKLDYPKKPYLKKMSSYFL